MGFSDADLRLGLLAKPYPIPAHRPTGPQFGARLQRRSRIFTIVSPAPPSTNTKPSPSSRLGRSPTRAIAPSTPTTGTASVVIDETVTLAWASSMNHST